MLTEGARVLALEAAGYKVKVITYVPAKHTPKNLMIRAQRHATEVSSEPVAAYRRISAAFGFVSPLEGLLPEVFGMGPEPPAEIDTA